jgi:hypothetical protein
VTILNSPTPLSPGSQPGLWILATTHLPHYQVAAFSCRRCENAPGSHPMAENTLYFGDNLKILLDNIRDETVFLP